MKKLIFMSLVGILGISTIFIACEKEVSTNGTNSVTKSIKNENDTKNPIENTEKANNTCSCSASGFWSSCSITCPVVHGVCLANCTTASVWGIGLLGSAAACTCGSVGAGKRYMVPAGVFYDDINVRNLKAIQAFIGNKPAFRDMNKELLDLLGVISAVKSGDLVTESQEFFDSMEHLSDGSLNLLKPVINQLMIINGRR